MQPSQTLINYIKQAEGFSPHAYLDPPGNTRGLHSTGYGHQIQPNEKALLTKTLTQPEAELMLNADLRSYVAATNLAIHRPVSQPQFDALVDLAYNAGIGSMQKVAATWNTTGSVTDTVAHLQLYNHSNGAVNPNLTKRRNHESNWFSGMIAGVEKKNP